MAIDGHVMIQWNSGMIGYIFNILMMRMVTSENGGSGSGFLGAAW